MLLTRPSPFVGEVSGSQHLVQVCRTPDLVDQRLSGDRLLLSVHSPVRFDYSTLEEGTVMFDSLQTWLRRRRKMFRPLVRNDRRPRLEVETLEERALMATRPFVEFATPSEGATVTTGPAAPLSITLRFSEDMNATEVETASNYALFNAQGDAIPVTVSTYNPATFSVVIAPDLGGAQLPADDYTLFIHGERISDAEGELMADNGQLVVVNTNSNSASLVDVPGNGQLGTSSNVPEPRGGGTGAQPIFVGLGDFSGVRDANGAVIPDMLVLNANNTFSIFQGRVGGGFDLLPTFTAPLAPPAALGAPLAAVIADFNNDLRLDFAVLGANNLVEVYLNTSTSLGNFDFDIGVRTTVGAAAANPVDITSADFDGDGVADIAIANRAATGGAYSVNVLRGFANGTFSTPLNFVVGTTAAAAGELTLPTQIVSGDLNNDGRPDLAVAGDNGVRVLRNSSLGIGSIIFPNNGLGPASLAAVISTIGPIVSLTTGQMNNDFNLDLIGVNQPIAPVLTSNVFVYRGTGTGTLALDQHPLPIDAIAVEVGDFDGDGLNDIAAAERIFPTAPGLLREIVVRRNITTASTTSFDTALSYTVDASPVSLATGDTNQDGLADLLSANSLGQTVTIFQGSGDDDLLRADTFLNLPGTLPGLIGPPPDSIAGDLNDDALNDLVLVNRETGVVSIFLATMPNVFPAAPTFSFGLTFGGQASGIALADLTGSGRPDIVLGVTTGQVAILENDTGGLGGFSLATFLTIPGDPSSIAAADFDGDNVLDLAVAHNDAISTDQRGLSVFLNTDNFTFTRREFLPRVAASAVVSADFNRDGFNDLAVADSLGHSIKILNGLGGGNFSTPTSFDTVAQPTSLAVADFNRDALPDLVALSGSLTTTDNIAVSLNAGNSFGAPIPVTLFRGLVPRNIIATNLNDDPYPDLVASVDNQAGVRPSNNLYTVLGDGDGNFFQLQHYLAGLVQGIPAAASPPSHVSVVSDPFLKVVSFTALNRVDLDGNGVADAGTVLRNLIRNGTFDRRDLTGEAGNLLGWQTFSQVNSHGRWIGYSGTTTPYSGSGIERPTGGRFGAVLDQADLVGTGGTPLNSHYTGTHVIYQDVFIPAGANALLSLNFSYTNNGDPFSSTLTPLPLDYLGGANQQIRIDLMDPSRPLLGVTGGTGGVIRNLFITDTGSDPTQPYTTLIEDVSDLAGRMVRLRIAVVNNRGQLIVGLDDVSLRAAYFDSGTPVINNLRLRNPGTNDDGTLANRTTDPTLIGQVLDDNLSERFGSPNAIRTVAFDVDDNGFFFDAVDVRTSNFDANGNFSVTLPGLLPGLRTVTAQAFDWAGNPAFQTELVFEFQGPNSTENWRAVGPDPINVVDTGVNYTTVSGKVMATALDPTDPTGNTYYLGADNGGVWKTTDGGANWTPMTDNIFADIARTMRVPTGVSSLVVAPSSPTTLYAATGVADNKFTSRPGVGVLKSTDGGQTWTLPATLTSPLVGARIVRVVVDFNNANVVYVGVASGGAGPGVYKSIDGGATWTNMLTPTSMSRPAAGFALPSVTDLVLDKYNSGRLLIGLGNMGLVTGNALGGVWTTGDGGNVWNQFVGGANLANSTIPTGAGVGRVTLAIGQGVRGDEASIFVLMGTPPPGGAPQPLPTDPRLGGYDTGTAINRLFKSANGGLDFTQVLVRQDTNATLNHTMVNISLGGHEASDAGFLTVDPTTPNVVYVGGTTRSAQPGDPPSFSLIRVDTRNMRDANYIDPNTATIPNDGDDIDAALAAASNGGAWRDPAATVYNAAARAGVDWYDLTSNTFRGTNPAAEFLPTGIHSLTFDALGRLLIGTSAGIYRGVGGAFTQGFITGGFSNSGEPGMKFSNLNGNLQIADLTSLALDPRNPTGYYAGAAEVGFASAGTQLDWTTIGRFGPIDPITGFVFDVESAAYIRTGGLDATSPNAQTMVYRNWAYLVGRGLVPETSIENGALGSYVDIADGIDPNNFGPLIPILVINPVKVFEDNKFQDEMLFGTDRVYHTRTNGDVWEQITPSKVGATGRLTTGVITALALSQSTPGVFFAGTNLGEIFYTTNSGADNWPLATTGLPAVGTAVVNGLAVDPDEPLTAYAMYGGTGIDHVYKTTDGGASWFAVSNGLPDAPAYKMVIDERPVEGAPNGRLYLGTEVGVYISLDGGGLWTELGNGLPHTPVVDLALNQQYETVAVATQGRGIFVISVDKRGPMIIEPVTPTTPNQPQPASPQPGVLQTITITFNEGVDPLTFNTDNIADGRSQIVDRILQTNNEAQNERIDEVYQTFFDRDATNAEQAAGRNVLSSQGLDALIATVAGSLDFYRFVTGGTDENNPTAQFQWFEAFTLRLLGREPTGAELDTALDTLEQAPSARAAVVAAFLQPDPATEVQNTVLAERVARTYRTFLRRNPTPAEVDRAVARLLSTTPPGNVEDFINMLVGSLEFYIQNGSVQPFDGSIAGGSPQAVAVGDIDRSLGADGKQHIDVVQVSSGLDQVLIFKGDVTIDDQGLNKGDVEFTFNRRTTGIGTPTLLSTLLLPSGARPSDVVLADLNGDGRFDIVTANSGTNNVSVFLWVGGANGFQFADPIVIPVGANPTALTVADFNSDGIVEIAVASASSVSIVRPLFGSATTVATGVGQLTDVAAGDLNGDNRPELVVSGATGIEALRNVSAPGGAITFGAATTMPVAGVYNSVGVGDVNADGRPDVIGATPNQGGQVRVFQNASMPNNNLNFPSTNVVTAAAGPNPKGIVIRDGNSDGRNDIYLVNDVAQGTVTYLRTQINAAGAMSLRQPASYRVGANPKSVAFGDVDLDLVADAFTAASGSDAFWTTLGYNNGSLVFPTDRSWVENAYKALIGELPKEDDIAQQEASLFGLNQIQLLTPKGYTTPLDVIDRDPTTHQVYDLVFAGQTFDGRYDLRVGPTVPLDALAPTVGLHPPRDLSGNPMNQNGNGTNGQQGDTPGGDRAVLAFVVNTSSNGGFVSGAINDLLGRPADTSFFLTLLTDLDLALKPLLLETIQTNVINTSVYRRSVVTDIYMRLLGRAPSTNEVKPKGDLQKEEKKLAAGKPRENLMKRLAAMNEYFALVTQGALEDVRVVWLKEVYREFLGVTLVAGRPEDDAILRKFRKAGSVAGRKDILGALLGSNRYREKVVNDTFAQYLFRLPTETELRDNVQLMATRRVEQVFAQLIASDEYFELHENTVGGWSDAAGRDLFPTPNLNPQLDLEAFIVKNLPTAALANTPETPDFFATQRMAAINRIFNTLEYRRKVVTDFYEEFGLGIPSTAELAAGVTTLGQTRGREQLIEDLLAGTRYFNEVGGGSPSTWLDQVVLDLYNRPRNVLAGEFNNLLSQARATAVRTLIGRDEFTNLVLNGAVQEFLRTNVVPTRDQPPPTQPPTPAVSYFDLLRTRGYNVLIAELLTRRQYYDLDHPLP